MLVSWQDPLNTIIDYGSSIILTGSYIGDLPFSDNIMLSVKDILSDFALCFNSELSIPVTIQTSSCF